MFRVVPLVIACAFFMENLDVTILNTAIPTIAEYLHENPLHIKVALTSYLLGISVLIPISGWLADKYGARNVLIGGITIFTIGSALCALSGSLVTLAMARFVQGIGGAILTPVGRIILVKSYPQSELIKVTSYVTIPALVGPALGPLIGGLIVTYSSWKYIFFANIPISILGIWLAAKNVTNFKVEHQQHQKFDLIGLIIFSLSLAGVCFSSESYGKLSDEGNQIMLAILLASFLLFIIFLIFSLKGKIYLFNLNLFAGNIFRYIVIGSFISRIGIGGVTFLLTLLLQVKYNFSPLRAGLLMVNYALGMIAMKLVIKKIIDLCGYNKTLIINTFLLGLALINLIFIEQDTSNFLIALHLAFLGFISSAQFSCLNVMVYHDIKEENISDATSIVSTINQLSMCFGVGISAAVFQFLTNLTPYNYEYSFIIIGLITMLSTLSFLCLKKVE